MVTTETLLSRSRNDERFYVIPLCVFNSLSACLFCKIFVQIGRELVFWSYPNGSNLNLVIGTCTAPAASDNDKATTQTPYRSSHHCNCLRYFAHPYISYIFIA